MSKVNIVLNKLDEMYKKPVLLLSEGEVEVHKDVIISVFKTMGLSVDSEDIRVDGGSIYIRFSSVAMNGSISHSIYSKIEKMFKKFEFVDYVLADDYLVRIDIDEDYEIGEY